MINFALNKMKASNVISNRTKQSWKLKDLFNNLSIVDWGKIPYFDMIINATSLGLSNKDDINLDFQKSKKANFYDGTTPKKQIFEKSKLMGNQTENGKKMFIHQAASAFKIWHNIYPEIDEEVNKLLD